MSELVTDKRGHFLFICTMTHTALSNKGDIISKCFKTLFVHSTSI